MCRRLPGRPLSVHELDALAEHDPIRRALPATPASISKDEAGQTRIRDVLLFVPTAVIAVAYVDADKEWVVVTREIGENPYEKASTALLDYRDYDVEDTETMQTAIAELYDLSNKYVSTDP